MMRKSNAPRPKVFAPPPGHYDVHRLMDPPPHNCDHKVIPQSICFAGGARFKDSKDLKMNVWNGPLKYDFPLKDNWGGGSPSKTPSPEEEVPFPKPTSDARNQKPWRIKNDSKSPSSSSFSSSKNAVSDNVKSDSEDLKKEILEVRNLPPF